MGLVKKIFIMITGILLLIILLPAFIVGFVKAGVARAYNTGQDVFDEFDDTIQSM